MLSKILLNLIILYFFSPLKDWSQDSSFIKVNFLYGSRPAKHYKETESKWFGGIFGGHVGIEIDTGKIFNFVHHGNLHLFPGKSNLHSSFVIYSSKKFWEILGDSSETVKKASVIIPVSQSQLNKLDSICEVYCAHTPYDYALFGMRCGAATYDVLAKIGIVKTYSYRKTVFKIFCPKILREKLFKEAQQNGWKVIKQEGTNRRIWEKD
jgi:hypothetical protein